MRPIEPDLVVRFHISDLSFSKDLAVFHRCRFCHMEPFVANCEMPEEGEMPANNFTGAREKSPLADTVDNAQSKVLFHTMFFSSQSVPWPVPSWLCIIIC